MDVRSQKRLGVRQWEWNIRAGRGQRKWIAARYVAPGITELVGAAGVGDLRTVWRILRNHAVGNERPDRIIKQRSAGTYGCAARSIRVVDQTKSRRQVRKPLVCESVRNSRIAIEQRAGRRIHVNLADLSSGKRRHRKCAAPIVTVVLRQQGLP